MLHALWISGNVQIFLRPRIGRGGARTRNTIGTAGTNVLVDNENGLFHSERTPSAH